MTSSFSTFSRFRCGLFCYLSDPRARKENENVLMELKKSGKKHEVDNQTIIIFTRFSIDKNGSRETII